MSAPALLVMQRKHIVSDASVNFFRDTGVLAGLLSCLAGMLLLAIPHNACAQFSGSATLVSDYRYRGVSFSEGDPEAQAALTYDSDGGWYVGGLVSGAKFYDVNTPQIVSYAGYAAAFSTELSWEVGADSVNFTQLAGYNYQEIFVGLSSENTSSRVYYSPSYFEQDARTIYAELNVTPALHDNVQLLAHAGLLRIFSGGEFSSRYDLKIGLNAKITDWNLQLAWVALQKKSVDYPQYQDLHPHGFVASASYNF